jgi:FkbM family methyltransferase
MHKRYYLLILLLLVILLLKYRYTVIYTTSMVSSNLICKKTHLKDYKQCGDLYINNNDISGPANSERLGLSWEPWLKHIIMKYRNLNKSALDIGAHVGVHTVTLSKYFKKVYAFEPNPNIFNNLQLNTNKLKNVTLFNKAVGDIKKSKKLIVKEINTHSYIEHFDETKVVEQINIDDLHIKDTIGFIKIDIEGYEIPAFVGMYNLIQRDNPIIVYEDHDGKNTAYLKQAHNYKIIKINSTNFIAMK